MKLSRHIFLSVLFVTLFLVNVGQVFGQSDIELSLSATYKYGEQITFFAREMSPLQVVNAFIVVNDVLTGVTYSDPVIFTTEGISEFRFDTQRNSLRPFTTVLWHYELTLADGSRLRSQIASLRYEDDRFDWQEWIGDGFRVHWYNSDSDFATSALNAGSSGLQKIAGFFVPDLSNPVDIYIYTNENDLRNTLYGNTESWMVGHADSAAGIVTVIIKPGADQNILMEQRIPHELMHVMLYRQVGTGYINVPLWLREGMAMLAEVYPNPEYDRVLKDAGVRGTLIPMLNLCASYPTNSDSAFLGYAQSRSFTNYLRGQYGSAGLLSLVNIYANGVDCEHGTERAFSVSLGTLERNWRTSLLGQNELAATLWRFAPYLALLCLVVLMPLIGVINSLRKKGNPNGL